MKIKINNIFKNKQEKKEEIIFKRRNNINNLNININKDNEYKVDNKEYRRNGAIRNKNLFNTLKMFTQNVAVKRNYYILFALMSILAVISVYTNFLTYKETNSESYEVFNNSDETAKVETAESSVSEGLQDVNSNNIDTRATVDNKNVVVSTNKNVVSNTNTNVNAKETVVPLSFVRPMNGEIIKVYSVDKLLFSKTLESWKTHDGVDIKANLGESVKSIEKGIVEKVYEDSFLGITIIIDHGQGYKSIYSNLDSSVNVKEKQIVKKSYIIGKLGKTSIGEIKDEPHIHFMLMFNNKVIDPISKIKF